MIHRFGKDVPFEGSLQRIEDALTKLEAAGIKIHKQSRYRKVVSEYEKALTAKASSLSPGHINWNLLAQGQCDATELQVIVSCQKLLEEHPRELQEMVKGSDFPWEDSPSRPRDVQFQLYITAVVSLAGFPVELCEPDLKFWYQQEAYSVAAKRVQRLDRLEERLKEAREQIAKSKIPGFIALGISQIARQETGTLLVARPDVLWEAGETISADLVEDRLKKLAHKTYDPCVIGYFVWITIPSVIPRLYSVGFTANFRSIYVAPAGHKCFSVSEEICKRVQDPQCI